MTVLLTGGCKSGKSSLAERLAVLLSASRPRYYLATLVPHDEEDYARIERHLRSRAGRGFETRDCPRNLRRCMASLCPDGLALVDSVTSLLANELFPPQGYSADAGERVVADLEALAHGMKDAVFVSDAIFSDSARYEPLTEQYRRALADCGRRLAAVCDVVIELCAGLPVVLKGRNLWRDLAERLSVPCGTEGQGLTLLVGGAYQGKLAFARERLQVAADDISVCGRDEEPDFSRRCLYHLENYLYYCVSHDRTPLHAYRKDAVLICTDISCGVVLIDRTERLWREAVGIYLREIAPLATVIRLCCGLPQYLSASGEA